MGLFDKLVKGGYKNERREKLFPETRKEVFFQLFKYHKRTLASVSLMCALFALPTVVTLLLSLLYKTNLPKLVERGLAQLPAAETEELAILYENLRMDRLAASVLFLTNILLFCGLGGGIRVVQLAVWGENISFFYDFGRGIKSNFKYFAGVALIFGLSYFFATFVITYYAVADTYAAVRAISIAIAILQFVFVAGCTVIALPHINVYDLSFFKTLKNSAIIFIASFPANAGLMILTVLPFALFLIPSQITGYIATLLAVFVFPATALTVWVLRTNAFFDRYLNRGESAGAYKKGLVWQDEGGDGGDD